MACARPLTGRTLPADESPCLTLILEPVSGEAAKNSTPVVVDKPGKPPPKRHRRQYNVTVSCNDCDKRLNFSVKTTCSTILTLQQLLTEDLDFLCSFCEAKNG
ncbi:transforming protein [Odocoileus virginianus papillomavirus 1]|uniref:Protein E7 n=1 Tax=Odocoileus virginianus papillomavirus 1 TaxID=2772504 RepID=VE7_OVPVD|nr:transforming protein [Deltapapillomavirus 2]P03131.2 RecName: Full=Protein E7 [Odocoileus virginianus papillomavirus 1]AAA66842.1 transforming protein [Odocoileus virginianus papillomavirus 1]